MKYDNQVAFPNYFLFNGCQALSINLQIFSLWEKMEKWHDPHQRFPHRDARTEGKWTFCELVTPDLFVLIRPLWKGANRVSSEREITSFEEYFYILIDTVIVLCPVIASVIRQTKCLSFIYLCCSSSVNRPAVINCRGTTISALQGMAWKKGGGGWEVRVGRELLRPKQNVFSSFMQGADSGQLFSSWWWLR